MKRRHVLGSIAALPALTALPSLAQKSPPEEFPKLSTTPPDAVAEAAPRFFNASEMATLRKLASLLVPRAATRPGALEAGAPEFLDFLIEESPADRQALYRGGLDLLDSASRHRFDKRFAEISMADAAVLLAPLETAWTYEGPADELARFLFAAKEDILRATMNSRQFASAATGRRGSGMGTYWLPVE